LRHAADGDEQALRECDRPVSAHGCASALPARTFPARHPAVSNQSMASGGETREPHDTPHLSQLDPERILRLLNEAGVEYVLIGGFAVVIHGYERLTADLDVCYARSRDNVRRLVDVLRALHAWPRDWPEGVPFVLDDQSILNGDSFTLETDAGDLDLIGTPGRLPWIRGLASWGRDLRARGRTVGPGCWPRRSDSLEARVWHECSSSPKGSARRGGPGRDPRAEACTRVRQLTARLSHSKWNVGASVKVQPCPVPGTGTSRAGLIAQSHWMCGHQPRACLCATGATSVSVVMRDHAICIERSERSSSNSTSVTRE
jgi:hypothetical protein